MIKKPHTDQKRPDIFITISREFLISLSYIKATIINLIQKENSQDKIKQYQLIYKQALKLNKLIAQLLDSRESNCDKPVSEFQYPGPENRTFFNNRNERPEIDTENYIVNSFHIDEVKSFIKNLNISQLKLKNKITNETKPGKLLVSHIRDKEFLRRAFAIVEKNLSNPCFHVSEFIDKMGMSRSIIHKKLKSFTNQSTSEFILSIRLSRALHLLNKGDKTITEISYEVGFNDYAYFYKCFKKLFGKTPKEYFKDSLY